MQVICPAGERKREKKKESGVRVILTEEGSLLAHFVAETQRALSERKESILCVGVDNIRETGLSSSERKKEKKRSG